MALTPIALSRAGKPRTLASSARSSSSIASFSRRTYGTFEKIEVEGPGEDADYADDGPALREVPDDGVDPVDETFIDTERASLRIFDMTWLGAPPSGQVVFTPPPFEVPASEIGQVFGLAYDDGRVSPPSSALWG